MKKMRNLIKLKLMNYGNYVLKNSSQTKAVYKLNQMRDVAGVYLEKDTEPKIRNDGKPLNNGDIYLPIEGY